MKTTLENNVLKLFLEGRIDSNNASEVEKQVMAALAGAAGAKIAVDAALLEYISSAGLRVLMKLRKQVKRALPVLNVSPEVYDIFEMTGFTELLDVQKRMREVSVEGCELIGSGGFGKVYRIDPETIVKTYSPMATLEMVQHDRDISQKAFLAGVPTAISYDVVRCGDCYGVVFEMLNARTVAQILSEDPGRVQEMGVKSANLLKELHAIEIDEGALPTRKAELTAWLGHLDGVLEETEIEEIRAFIQSVPDRNTFLHGDFNSKNIMVQQDGEFILIDIGDAATGHPVFDIASLVLPYLFLPKTTSMPREEIVRLLGFQPEEGPKMWGTMVSAYFGTADPGEIQRITEMVMPYAQLLSSYQGTRRSGFDPELMRQRSMPGFRRLLDRIREAKPLDW